MLTALYVMHSCTFLGKRVIDRLTQVYVHMWARFTGVDLLNLEALGTSRAPVAGTHESEACSGTSKDTAFCQIRLCRSKPNAMT
jgi:hypothetical protein